MLKLRYRDTSADAAWLAEPGITIGSDSVSTLVIDGPDVRGFHADVRVGADGAWVKEVGAAGGTLVNGKALDGEVPLRPGDVLSVGGRELEVVESRGDAGAGPRDAAGSPADEPAGDTLPAGTWGLHALTGPLAGRSFALQAKTVVGRAEDCDISIPEARLSREHAQLVLAGELLSMRDLGSSNGTFHNGERVERALLAVGDTVAFDKVEFRVIGPAPGTPDLANADDGFDKTIITTASAAIAQAAPAASPQATTGINPNVPHTAPPCPRRSRSVSSTSSGSGGTRRVLIVALVVLAGAALALFVF